MFLSLYCFFLLNFYSKTDAKPVFNVAKGEWEYSAEDKVKVPTNLGSQRGFYQGDIVGISQPSKFRNGIKFQILKWPDGIIPYAFASTFSASQVTNIANAMLAVQAKTCIRFTPKTSHHKDYIYFENTPTGCNSRIGKAGGGQRISLQRGMPFDFCLQQASVTHELLHTVGLWHEHARFDRDPYLTVNLNNVLPDERHNFDKVRAEDSDTYGAPYDYQSIMHYGRNAAAVNPFIDVLITKDTSMQDMIGRAELPSYWDYYKVNQIYNCQQDNKGQLVSIAKCADYVRDCGSYADACSNAYIKIICPVTCWMC